VEVVTNTPEIVFKQRVDKLEIIFILMKRVKM